MKKTIIVLLIFTIMFSFNASNIEALPLCTIDPTDDETICEPEIPDPPPQQTEPGSGTCECRPQTCTTSFSGSSCAIKQTANNCKEGYTPECRGEIETCYICPYNLDYGRCIINQDTDYCPPKSEIISTCTPGKRCTTTECKCVLEPIEDCGALDQACCPTTPLCNTGLVCEGNICVSLKENGELCDFNSECISDNCVPIYNEFGTRLENNRCCPSDKDYYDKPIDSSPCSKFGKDENIVNNPENPQQRSCNEDSLYVDSYKRCCRTGFEWKPEYKECKEQAEEDCAQGTRDEDGNGESNYDSSDGLHGDIICPVEISSITVPSTVNSGTTFNIECQTNIPNLNSISAIFNNQECNFIGWNSNTAKFSCNSGSIGTYTAICTVQDGDTIQTITLEDKSYQTGTDKTRSITVTQTTNCNTLTQSECNTNQNCEWCPTCQENKYNQIGTDSCVSAGACSYLCQIDQCGATWDEDVGGCPDNVCTDQNNLRLYEGDPDLCICDDSTSSVIQCTGQTCEESYPASFHLTGTCISDCITQSGSDYCDSCIPEYDFNPAYSDCICQEGWTDANKDPNDGCESTCIPTDTTDCCGDGIDNDCDGMIDNNCDKDGDGYIDSYIYNYRPERMCPGIQ